MYSMVIPKANLTPEAVQIIGDLAVYHRATILSGNETTTIEFRTLRLNGADVPGEERARQAREKLLLLAPSATSFDPIPEMVTLEDNPEN
jgi:hypothetical protein